jgi:hypothetical protein
LSEKAYPSIMTFAQAIADCLASLPESAKSKWFGSKYEKVKYASTTDKGSLFGEALIVAVFTLIGVTATIVNKGKGSFDILAAGKRWEVKLATEDVNDKFQFNGIKKGVDYDYVICLGVAPNDLWFNIFSKVQCQQLSTPMSKDGSDTYKLTASKDPRSKWHVKALTDEVVFAVEVEKYV